MAIHIRDAEPDDLEAVLGHMRALAEHEGMSVYFALTAEALRACCMGSAKRFHVLVAVSEGAVVGYATYMFQFSPWAGREYLFLDDLYVSPEARGAGIGARLMQRVAQVALERDVDARWHVEMDNRAAQKFYRTLGAELREKRIAYWLREVMRTQA
ncbi:MAG TPA: GNAT family N-acetyltransferase [Thermoanaerobaculia bacterium]